MYQNVRLLNYYTISMNFLCCIAVLIPYYSNHIGLSFQQFLISEAIFASVVFALEVPSGWISDVWKRKHVLVTAACIYVFGFTALLLADRFLTVILAQAYLGVAVSLASGTNTAMLYDSLLSINREAEFTKLEGRRVGLRFYSFAVSSILGGILYEINPQLPFIITVLACIPAVFFATMLIESPRAMSTNDKNPVRDMFDTMKYALHGHKEIAFIIIFAAVLASSTKLIMWSQQPYYMALEVPEFYFGFLIAIGAMLGGTCSQFSYLFQGRVSNIRMLFFIFLAAIAICFFAGFFVSYAGIILLMFGGSCLYGLANPRVDNAINQRVSSERRATILSTKNLLAQLFFIPASLLIGYLSTQNGIGDALFGIVGWLMLGGLCIALWELYKMKRLK